MRIVSGEFKGRRLPAVKEKAIRPTTDRVREAIFSSLSSRMDLEGKFVLDLFAGTGALGIEAISRGAAYCFFVERQLQAAKTIKDTLEQFGASSRADVICEEVFSFLKQPLGCLKRSSVFRPEHSFDLVFADPPYRTVSGVALVQSLLEKCPVHPGTVFLFENDETMAGQRELPLVLHKGAELSAILERERIYSGTVVSYVSFE